MLKTLDGNAKKTDKFLSTFLFILDKKDVKETALFDSFSTIFIQRNCYMWHLRWSDVANGMLTCGI